MGVVRNIEVNQRNSGNKDLKGIYSKQFTDWYDFADWLKQENEKGNEITIVSWRYKDTHL